MQTAMAAIRRILHPWWWNWHWTLALNDSQYSYQSWRCVAIGVECEWCTVSLVQQLFSWLYCGVTSDQDCHDGPGYPCNATHATAMWQDTGCIATVRGCGNHKEWGFFQSISSMLWLHVYQVTNHKSVLIQPTALWKKNRLASVMHRVTSF